MAKNTSNALTDTAKETLRYALWAIPVGGMVGLASAFFLWLLDAATTTREANPLVVAALPMAGLLIAHVYTRYGASERAGNDRVISEFVAPRQPLRLRMAPMVLFATVLTHLVGGSAGREGTAVQMGASLADQFARRARLKLPNRKLLLQMGVAAGFGAVFGTPIAGAIFALEVLSDKRVYWRGLLPAFAAGAIGHFACIGVGILHSKFTVVNYPKLSLETVGWLLLAALAFGFAARMYNVLLPYLSRRFTLWVHNPRWRAAAGGALLAVVFLSLDASHYMGLGVPVIEDAFVNVRPWHDFIAKLVLTAFTLAVGFKGGEVTPLFFIGVTLGSALSTVIPLPLDFLAAIGFVAVFAGATNAPLACTAMALELFGFRGAGFYLVATVVAFAAVGKTGIYKTPAGRFIHPLLGWMKR